MPVTPVTTTTVRLVRSLASTYSTVLELRRWARTWGAEIGPEARAELEGILSPSQEDAR